MATLEEPVVGIAELRQSLERQMQDALLEKDALSFYRACRGLSIKPASGEQKELYDSGRRMHSEYILHL